MKFSAERYEGLDLSFEFQRLATENPEEIVKLCNGVGSTVGWAKYVYHFIPNTIWLLDVTPASDIHDVDYVYPQAFETYADAAKHKRQADLRFYNNCCFLINTQSSVELVRDIRLKRAWKYYLVLISCGGESFLENKTILFPTAYDKNLWFPV